MQVLLNNRILWFRPGAMGGIPGPCPPKWLLVPPSEDFAPKKLTGSGLLECKSRPKLVFATGIFVVFVDFMTFLGWRLFFWDQLFSAGKTAWIPDFGWIHPSNLEITCFWPAKLHEFPISAGKTLAISVKTFFFWDHLFSVGKTAWIPDFGRKIPLKHLVHLINFSCRCASLEFT